MWFRAGDDDMVVIEIVEHKKISVRVNWQFSMQ